MAKRVRKAVNKGVQFAAAAKRRLETELKALIKMGMMSKPESKKITKAFIAEMRAEKNRILAFAKQELNRGFVKAKKSAKPLVKKAVARYKKARKR